MVEYAGPGIIVEEAVGPLPAPDQRGRDEALVARVQPAVAAPGAVRVAVEPVLAHLWQLPPFVVVVVVVCLDCA